MPNRTQLYYKIMELYPRYLSQFPQTKIVEILYARYSVGDMRHMTIQQVDDFLAYLQSVLNSEKEYA